MNPMNNTKEEVAEKYTEDNRIIGEVHGSENGPTLMIFAGIHGNEKAGVLAAEKVLQKIREENMLFRGNVHFVLGNIHALNRNVRFMDADLNRIWTRDKMQDIKNESVVLNVETKEQISIYEILINILKSENGPYYFLDLHTTSSPSVPFITISDSLNNRKFSSYFPVPIVLGIEEYLEGPLLTFINDHGYISLGFEGGQHTDPESVVNCEYFIWKSLVHSGCIEKDQVRDFQKYRDHFSKMCCKHQFFEITYRYALEDPEAFSMHSKFQNFQPIRKDDLLAFHKGKEVRAEQSGRIFMPLYQAQGEEGYFILKNISKFWLGLSKVLRKWKVDNILRVIPGVKQDPQNNFTLIVDPKIARFLAKEIFHLFGYRQQIYRDDKLHFIKRDRKLSEMP
jgi:succinylglutamate desuccinylase